MNKFLYYIKQLLPLEYHSKYSLQNGEKRLTIWRQWLSRPFDIEHYTLAD